MITGLLGIIGAIIGLVLIVCGLIFRGVLRVIGALIMIFFGAVIMIGCITALLGFGLFFF